MTANTYEALIIFKPILDVENVDAILNHFEKDLVQANGGEIVEVDKIGRKRLAYEIKKFRDGFLTLYILKFPPDAIKEFRRLCQIEDDILRMTLMRVDQWGTREVADETRRGPRRDFRGEGRRDEGRRDHEPARA